MVMKGKWCTIYSFSKGSNSTPGAYSYYLEQLHSSKLSIDKERITLGDFNADGKTDLLIGTTVYFSTGTSLVYGTTINFSTQPNPINTYEHVRVGDFNGDGFSDIIHVRRNYNPTTKSLFDVYLNRGGTSFYREYYDSDKEIVNSSFDIGDFNGDGKSEVIIHRFTNAPTIFRFYPNATNHLLETVQDGFNRQVSFQYDKATTGTVFTKGSGRSYPINNVQLPMFLVKNMVQPDGIGGTITTSYNYTDAWLHRRGLGFLGFAKVKSSSSVSGVSSGSTSNFDLLTTSTELYMPYLKTTVSTVGPSTTTTTTVPKLVSQGNNRWWLQTESTSSTNNYSHNSSEETFVYDTNGNVKETFVSVNNGLETAKTTSIYVQTDAWTPPSSITTTIEKTRQGFASYKATTTSYFDTKDGKLLSETILDGTPLWVKTEFPAANYNKIGLPELKIVSCNSTNPNSPGIASRTSSMTYTPNGRFVKTTVNPLGQTSTVTYDKRWGKPTTSTGIDGLTSSATYDGFGRLSTSTNTLGKTSIVDYVWNVSASTLYNVVETVPGRPTTKKYVDIFERATTVTSSGFKDPTIANPPIPLIETTTVFDARGNAIESTSPHYNGDPSVLTTTIYDDLNRVTNITNSAGTTIIAYDYDQDGNLTVTKIDAKKVTDAAGKTTSTTDNGGTLLYEYNSFGNQLSVSEGPTVTSPGGLPLSVMTYDEAGRQMTLYETNAGPSSYKYNAWGELEEDEIAGAPKTKYQYNDLGQVTERVLGGPPSTVPAITTTYTYFTSGAAVNQVNTINYDGKNTIFGYDTKGRKKIVTEQIKGRTYTTQYAYDDYNNLVSMEYPSGLSISRHYNTEGYLLDVTDDATSKKLYESSKMDALGHFTDYKLGNDVTSKKDYNIYGYPTRFKATGAHGPVQNLGFDFDLTNGNLRSRSDDIKGKSESFTYDNLERLENAGGMAMTYSPNGNIETKTDLGTYSYNPPMVHAVVGVSSYPVGVNRLSQDINYTGFHQPAAIQETFSWPLSPTGTRDVSLSIEYGYDYNRRFATNGYCTNDAVNVYYVGDYEEIVYVDHHCDVTRVIKINYIYGGDGLCAIATEDSGNPSGVEFNYVYTDHLGSILTLTDKHGQISHQQSFDAWGRRRDPVTWDYISNYDWWHYYQPQPNFPVWLIRGFTGHEHLDVLFNIDLINMNARLYDPVVARMLRWDTYAGDGTQGVNRYSYAMNNPLKYTDPTGNFLVFAIPEISWSRSGGLYIGLTFGVGVPGGLSASASVGYSFGSKQISASVQVSAAGFYAGVGTGGAFAGWGYRYGGFSGGVSWSKGSGLGVGLSYGGSRNNFNGSVGLGWSQNGGWDFNIGGGYTVNGEVTRQNITSEGIETHGQRGANNCLCTCLETVESSYGNSTPQEYVRSWVGGNPETQATPFSLFDDYMEASGNNVGTMPFNEKQAFRAMQMGAKMVVNFSDKYTGVPNTGHSMVMKSGTIWKLELANGRTFTRYNFKLMNPGANAVNNGAFTTARGGYVNMSGSYIKNNTWNIKLISRRP
jgi:RHS repeat-associated protein